MYVCVHNLDKKMRVDVYRKLRRRRGKFFDKEIIGNRAGGAKKKFWPPPSWTKEKILAPPL